MKQASLLLERVKPDPNQYDKSIGPAWQEERGYWCIWMPGKNGKRGRLYYMHRLIYEQAYGSIPRGFVIHHRDGDKSNCSLGNLELLTRGAHSRLHFLGKHRTHIAGPDGMATKLCVLCGRTLPLSEMVRRRNVTGTMSFRPNCGRCYARRHGWAKHHATAQ